MAKPEQYTSNLIQGYLDQASPREAKKIELKMLIAAKILDALERKGWRKKDLAEKMNKRPSEITKWLSGTHNFTVNTLEEIGYHLSIDFFGSLSPFIPSSSKGKHAA